MKRLIKLELSLPEILIGDYDLDLLPTYSASKHMKIRTDLHALWESNRRCPLLLSLSCVIANAFSATPSEYCVQDLAAELLSTCGFGRENGFYIT